MLMIWLVVRLKINKYLLKINYLKIMLIYN